MMSSGGGGDGIPTTIQVTTSPPPIFLDPLAHGQPVPEPSYSALPPPPPPPSSSPYEQQQAQMMPSSPYLQHQQSPQQLHRHHHQQQSLQQQQQQQQAMPHLEQQHQHPSMPQHLPAPGSSGISTGIDPIGLQRPAALNVHRRAVTVFTNHTNSSMMTASHYNSGGAGGVGSSNFHHNNMMMNSNNNTICMYCGVDRAVLDGMEQTRRKLDLLQEKVEVESALLQNEKKNFKRKLKASKMAVVKQQQAAAQSVRESQLKLNALQNETDASIKDTLRAQQQSYELKLLELEQASAAAEHEHTHALGELQTRLARLQIALDEAEEAKLMEAQRVRTLQSKLQQTEHQDGQSSGAAVELVAQLERENDDKQQKLESLEMQLLELERETGGTGGSGVNPNNTPFHGNDCAKCRLLDRQLSNAHLTVDTVNAQLAAADLRLSHERELVKNYKERYEAAQRRLDRESASNDQRLKVVKDLHQTEQDLKSLRNKMALETRHYQERIVALQAENERLEGLVEELQKKGDGSNDGGGGALQRELDQGEGHDMVRNKTEQGVVTAAASEDTASLAAAPPPAADASDDDDDDEQHLQENQKLVMEMEWHGTEWSGVYTGSVDIATKQPDGSGTLRLDDGAVYDGDWRMGLPHGRGVYATVEGDLHSSGWRAGVKHGRAVDVWSDGRVYRGTYVHGDRHGHGVLTWPYGAHYTGQFAFDKRNGRGVYVYADGRCYTGCYQDDRPHGYGVMTSADGSVLYDGMWQLGEFLGRNDV
jgi:hypothetical protein